MALPDDFRDPPASYRSAPFWSWNDELTDEELTRQIRAFHEAGIGGFFMHSRVGLLTDYLSEEWMARVKTCVDAARELGMKAWLYDEDSYPSGYAGGLVPGADSAFRAKGLRMQKLSRRDTRPYPALATFRIDDDTMLVFDVVKAGDSSWFNGFSYIDTCQPAAVEKFIETTHEAYRARFRSEFGRVIPGIFTDEPQASCSGCPGPCLPWTDRLPDEFRRRKGYDLMEHLPSLFLDTPDARRVRLDYWDVHTQLFTETFCKRIYDWCEENGLALTGHFWEHAFPSTAQTGSTMPHYEYMQMPGIDLLFNQYNYDRPHGQGRQFGNVMMVREVGSVAHQLGRPRVLSETYGGAGWELSFRDQKRIGDWEFCLGVNFLCQHLSLMSLRGCRKRDFPPSFLPHQPWWPEYRLLGDYFGRLSLMLSQGEPVADALVLHPYHSIWALTGGLGPDPQVGDIARAFIQLNDWLAQIHRTFDLGDETLIEKHGRVEGDRFVVGWAEYKIVVVPPCLLLRRATFELLERFADAGGPIVFVEPAPTLVDAASEPRLDALLARPGVQRIALDREALRGALAVVEPEVKLNDDADTVYYQHRIADGRSLVFLSNVDEERGYELEVELPARERVTQWSLTDGRIVELESESCAAGRRVRLFMPPVGSALLAADGVEPAEPAEPQRSPVRRVTLDATASPANLNSAVLDRCRYRIGDGPWSEPMYVQAAFAAIRQHYGLEHDNHNRGVQLWLARKSYRPLQGDTRVALRYEFLLEGEPPSELYFVTETPERYAIQVNGRKVEGDAGYWFDPAFRQIDISAAAASGVNVVELTCADFDMGMEIEACYLAGAFGAAWDGERIALAPPPARVELGDWRGQGYPFFVGAMRYEAEADLPAPAADERVVLGLGRWEGAVARVSVNGRRVGPIAWPPYELDVTEFLRPGRNAFAIEVLTSLRNLLGPHHRKEYQPGMVGPGSFYEPNNWRDDYDLIPQGLMDPAWLEWRR